MLSDEQIEAARIAVFKEHGSDLIPAVATSMARAIEAEVRKQDTALIRQLVEALEHATAWAEEWRFAPAWVADAQAAICVAGVWLEGKP